MNAKVNSITSKGCVLITSEYCLLVVGYSFSLAKIVEYPGGKYTTSKHTYWYWQSAEFVYK